MTEPGPVWARQVPDAALAWVHDATGSRVRSVRSLGGSWLANHAVTLDGGQELVLRRWARPGWADDDPDLTADREATVLDRLADSPLPVPALVAADADAAHADVPALLLTLLPGTPPAGPPDLDQLIGALDALHTIDPEGVPAFTRYNDPVGLSVPGWAQERGVWEIAIAVARRDPPELPDRLIHRDPHPGNTLWAERRLTGIVDWTTGSRGPAAVDLAHLRANLAMDHGIAASGAVLPHPDRHPYWDIAITLDFAAGRAAPTQLQIARLEAHLSAALADLMA